MRTRLTHASKPGKGFIHSVLLMLLFTAGTAARQHSVNDVNADDCPDLLSLDGINQIIIQRNDCSGQLLTPEVLALPHDVLSFELGDLNLDGFDDLVTVSTADDLFFSLHNQVNGYLSGTPVAIVLDPLEAITDIKLAWVNDDSILDMVVMVDGLINGEAVVLYGDGSGDFTSSVSIDLLTMLSGGQSVHVELVNDDEHPDILIRDVLGQVYVLLADGLGGFNPEITLPSLLPTGTVYFADHNHDGLVDMLVLDELLGLLTLRSGNGDGSFAAGTHLAVGLMPSGLVSVDLNLDGHQDVITANLGDNTINVLLGDGVGGLMNLVGSVLDDLIGVLPTLNLPVGVVAEDLNGDCRPDVAIWNQFTESHSVVINQSGPDPQDLIFCNRFD
jgi:hypothetical protein